MADGSDAVNVEIRRISPDSSLLNEKFVASYVTDHYYDVAENPEEDGFSFRLQKKPFGHPVEKHFDFDLNPEYFRPCEDYALYSGDHLAGILEIHHETWNNRLRVTELWIEENFRRRGFGGTLLDLAKERGKALGCRGLVLETQSCNAPAIGCYLRNGFSFIGLDTTCYTNHDLESREVRLEMGWTFPEKT